MSGAYDTKKSAKAAPVQAAENDTAPLPKTWRRPANAASTARSAGTNPSDQSTEMDNAAQSISAPLPRAKEGQGHPFATEQAPTVDDVFDPQRPALEGASEATLLAIIQQNVNDLYKDVLFVQLDALKLQLAKTAPVPETPFAMKLLGWVVETVASHAIGYMSGFLGKALFGHETEPESVVSIGGTEAEPAVTVAAGAQPVQSQNPREKAVEHAGETAGHKAGDLLKEKVLERPTSEPTEAERHEQPALTTGGLLDEFVVRERHMLLAKKSDIMTRLMLMHDHAGGQAKADTVDLGNRLRNLIETPALTAWFRNKVTMEWLNFIARVSLGPRAEGQSTDLRGANAIGGIAAGGTEAQRQWSSADGMIEIVLDVPETVRGLSGVTLRRATVPSSYGALPILQRLDGSAYNLATLPVYRRVWLKTGESKLDESPAFVITPDGRIEADVGNPVLDAIGATKPVKTGNLALDALGVGNHSVHVGETGGTSGSITDQERGDPAAFLAHGSSFVHCMAGADLIRGMIAGIPMKAIQ